MKKMNRIHSWIVLTALLFSGLQVYSQCEILLWEEEFNGDQIDRSRWNVLNDNSGGGNQELQYYTSRDTNVYVENGKLIIRALEEQYGEREYTSGILNTRGIADWKYGRLEAKIKMPEGQGMWPAFWLLPSQNKFGEWPNSGEIDIVEMVGHEPDKVYGTIHYGPPWGFTNGDFTLTEGKFSDSAFVFSIEWSDDSIHWYVNDILYSSKTATSLNNSELWPIFRERFYLILNLAVGGNWPGSPDQTTQFPQTMEVDYVRVYGDPQDHEIIALDSAYAMATGIRYTFTDIPGASFTWSVPPGAQIVSGQGSNTIEVDWECTEGNVSLSVTNI
ncbi:MAG: glycoside hydrolase family 16 protein, partial [Bacteroidales bacterium]|nr:glycoside hydrolase family 16 protein [Bacteroidales bacterium]